MSECNKTNQIVSIYAADNINWTDSTESIRKKTTTKSETSLKMDSVDLLMLKSESFKSERGATSVKIHPPVEEMKVKQKETEDEKILHVPPKLLSGELTVLRVTLTPPESTIKLLASLTEEPKQPKRHPGDMSIFEIIDGSEAAPKDRVPWKYLKRSRQYNKEKKKFMVTWLRTVHYHYSHVLGRRRMNLTCQNCTLNVKTNIRHVNTIRTRRNACILTPFGLCGLPYILFLFKDVVHICPFCNIYLGFCPAFKYPRAADVVTDVIKPISLTSLHKIRERVAGTYDAVSKVLQKSRKLSPLAVI